MKDDLDSKKITAVIPVKGNSTRCKNKNIRSFGDTNLLKLKIETLKQVKGIDSILVSSNCDKLLEVAKDMGVNIHKRDEKYCTNDNPGHFFCNLASAINTDILMHVPVTTPLISTNEYNKIINQWNNLTPKYDSLNATTKIKEFIWHNNKPVNYDHKNPVSSQDLPNFSYLNFGCNIITKQLVFKLNNIVGENPFLYNIDAISAIDIDENADFITAELLYNNHIVDHSICKNILTKRVDTPELIDCTIRDGGYLNNWDYTDEEVLDCYKAATKCGVDYFEIGFRTNKRLLNKKGKWCYSTEEDINNIANQYKGTKICLMAKVGTVSIDDFIEKKYSNVDMVRVLVARINDKKKSQYSKADLLLAKNLCNDLLSLGYEVCLNLGCGDLISDAEIKMTASIFNDVKIKALYLADTYGGFNYKNIPMQIHKFYEEFNHYNSNIKLGFHIHNNNGDGLEKSNIATFNGCTMIDISIGGLGRGSGNLKSEEYICHKFREHPKLREKITPIIEFYDKHIQSKKAYNNQNLKLHHPLYNIAGSLSLHPDYILELLENVEQTVNQDIDIIFQLNRYTIENNCRNYDKNLIKKLTKSCT